MNVDLHAGVNLLRAVLAIVIADRENWDKDLAAIEDKEHGKTPLVAMKVATLLANIVETGGEIILWSGTSRISFRYDPGQLGIVVRGDAELEPLIVNGLK